MQKKSDNEFVSEFEMFCFFHISMWMSNSSNMFAEVVSHLFFHSLSNAVQRDTSNKSEVDNQLHARAHTHSLTLSLVFSIQSNNFKKVGNYRMGI